MAARRDAREYARDPLGLTDVGQLLWAAQGTVAGRVRTAPSQADYHPFEIYLVAGAVDGLAAGVYRYDSSPHALEPVVGGDKRDDVAGLALGQGWIADAPIILILAVKAARAAAKYGTWSERYVLLEAGHIAGNVLLQAASLGLGTAQVGAFRDTAIRQMTGMASEEEPVYILTVGKVE